MKLLLGAGLIVFPVLPLAFFFMCGQSLVELTEHNKSAADIVAHSMYMYGHTYSKSMDQPGKVANPACGQLNREKEYFPVHLRA